MLTKSSVQTPRPCWLGAFARGQSVGGWGGLLFVFPLLLSSRSVMSVSLWPHGPQHTRLPCPSPSPGACSNLRPLSQWWAVFYWDRLNVKLCQVPVDCCLRSGGWERGETVTPWKARAGPGLRVQTPSGPSAWAPWGRVSAAEFLPRLHIPVRLEQLQKSRERTSGLTALNLDLDLTPLSPPAPGPPQYLRISYRDPSWGCTGHRIFLTSALSTGFLPLSRPTLNSPLLSQALLPLPSLLQSALLSHSLTSWQHLDSLAVISVGFLWGWERGRLTCICSTCHINQKPL